MKPYTKPYVNPSHVDDPESDPLSVPADHLSPDSTASHRPAARLTVNKPTRPEAACLCARPVFEGEKNILAVNPPLPLPPPAVCQDPWA
jgi:hypothetical protein